MSFLIQNATYWKSFEKYHQIPDNDCSEVVFAGRSNAGKSSAINTLTNQKKLAHVSKLPGRTRLLNFFQLDEGKYIVDLPGYGYARVSEATREAWGRELTKYLSGRRQIRGLFAVMDIRHAPTPLDEQLVEWFSMTGKPIHVLLTKADKLRRTDSENKLREVSKLMSAAYPLLSCQIFSSSKKMGIEQARNKLYGWLL